MIIYLYKYFQLMFICLLVFGNIYANSIIKNNQSHNDDHNRTKYVTDDNGSILIHVNVWGHVKLPGNHLVYDGIDLISLLSVVGGPHPGADMDNIVLIREVPDINGNIKYKINLDTFYKEGNRDNLVEILPNDTIIIKEKPFRNIISSTNILSSLLQILNIYLQIQIIGQWYYDRK